jgi:glutamyl-tRNA synthetase
METAADSTLYFFEEQPEYDPSSLIQKGMEPQGTLDALKSALATLNSASTFDHESLEELLRATGLEIGVSPRQFFGALRTAVTGRTATPPLFETMEVLGRERVLRRMEWAVERLASANLI